MGAAISAKENCSRKSPFFEKKARPIPRAAVRGKLKEKRKDL